MQTGELFAKLLLNSPVKVRLFKYSRFTGPQNMALDHYFASGTIDPDEIIVRFYGWSPSCISLGFHQSGKNLDFEKLKSDKIDIVKRPTGGRAIFHAEELTYSVIVSKSRVKQDRLYQIVHLIIASALNEMGYNVVFAESNKELQKISNSGFDLPCFTSSAETEIRQSGKKLVGSAQKVYRENILQHGSILIGARHLNLTDYIIMAQEQKESLISQLQNKTICLRQISRKSVHENKVQEEIIHQLEKISLLSLIYGRITNDILLEATRFYEQESTFIIKEKN